MLFFQNVNCCAAVFLSGTDCKTQGAAPHVSFAQKVVVCRTTRALFANQGAAQHVMCCSEAENSILSGHHTGLSLQVVDGRHTLIC